MIELVIGVGGFAFGVYSWFAQRHRETNHRIALALTAAAIDVSYRIDDVLASSAEKTYLEALDASIRRFEEAFVEGRAAWGRVPCRPAANLHLYVRSLSGLVAASRAGVPQGAPLRVPDVDPSLGSLGVTWSAALQGDASAIALIDRHLVALVAAVEKLTKPHLSRPLDDDEEAMLLRRPPAEHLTQIIADAERQLPSTSDR